MEKIKDKAIMVSIVAGCMVAVAVAYFGLTWLFTYITYK